LDENCCGVATAIIGPTAGIVNSLGGLVPSQSTPFNFEADPFDFETAVNVPQTNEIDDSGASLQLDWKSDLLGGATFTSITSYRENDYDYFGDSDFTTLELLEDTFQFVGIETFTQEFRIASNNDGRFQWLVGGFYSNEDITQDSGLDYGADLRAYIDALATGGASLQLGPQVRIEEEFTQDNESWSVFGNVDFNVTDRLTITLGGNYTDDAKRVTASTVNNDDFSNLTLTGADGTQIISTGLFLDRRIGSFWSTSARFC